MPEPNNPIPRTTCTATSCPDPTDDEYVIKTEPVADTCCPRLIRTACKHGATVYQVYWIHNCVQNLKIHIFVVLQPGDTWPSPSGDPCHKFVCLQYLDGSIIKQQQTESCSGNCPTVRYYFDPIRIFLFNLSPLLFKGWEYQSSPTICCGTCHQVACVTEDAVHHAVNSTWKSDVCTTSTCVSRENGVSKVWM